MRTLADRFSFHAVEAEQIKSMSTIRMAAYNMADQIALIHECRERSLALTKLEEVVFWANAAISRGPENGS